MPKVNAEVTYFLANIKRRIGINAAIVPTAAISFHKIWNWLTSRHTPIENVCEVGVAVKMSANKNSFQDRAKVITAIARIAGDSRGRVMAKNA